MEIWKPIVGYTNYDISNLGKVRSWLNNSSKRQTSPKLLKLSQDKNGYLSVTLYPNAWTRPKRFLVHRLVAQAFIPNPQNCKFVNHKDENKANNNMYNLEWCTAIYNLNYSAVHQKGLKTKQQIKSKNAEKPIIALCANLVVLEYKSISEASRNGFSRWGLRNCLSGKTKTHKGFMWKFK